MQSSSRRQANSAEPAVSAEAVATTERRATVDRECARLEAEGAPAGTRCLCSSLALCLPVLCLLVPLTSSVLTCDVLPCVFLFIRCVFICAVHSSSFFFLMGSASCAQLVPYLCTVAGSMLIVCGVPLSLIVASLLLDKVILLAILGCNNRSPG